MAGSSKPKLPSPIDRRIGQIIRLRRMECSMSQEELAAKLGLTFQQVQKYEKGRNRVSAGRLQEIAMILGVSAGYFYDEPSRQEERSAILTEEPQNLPLLQAFKAITDPKLRRQAIALVQALADIET